MFSRSLQDHLSRQSHRLTNKDIDRRQFVMSALAAGITLPAALGMADRALAAAPKRGGKFRYGSGYGSTTDSLDPGTSENAFTQAVGYAYGNHLTEVDNNGILVPELAESFEPSNGGKIWIFNLRKGVEFHNGKSFTADDVIATFDYHSNEASKSAAKGLVSAVVSIKKDSPHRVIFDLKEANADFPYIVSDYHLVIQPAEGDAITPLSGMGTGGYVLDKFAAGERATFNRNRNYFKEDRAHFDELEFISILDITARQNAIMNNSVDHIDRVDPKTVHLMARMPNLTILETTGTEHYTLPMRLDVIPFDNYDLRMALKYSLKRQEMVDKIMLGHGAVGNDIPLSPSTPFYNHNIPQREFDADKAAYHFKKSGYSGPIQLSTSDAAFPGAVDAAQLVAASAKEAGINIEVVREPKDGYWSNVWNKKGWSACYWSGRPTQDWMYSAAYTSDTEWNDTAWR
ncbi:MAG: ABC transporter substrate-binding protein, partial [Alphaproteobacteria bacterium]|nr:ABC transporter substrate-binding protein [Alphaproteobacteria bacterium]